MKTINKHNVLVLIGLITIFSCGHKAEKEGTSGSFVTEKLDSALQNVFAKNKLMGMSVVLLADQKMVWQGTYGKADASRDLPVTENTVYRVASISKTVTAVALLQLWEQGKINLDEDVSTYLGWVLRHPEYPKVSITLRQLLSHQSGIRDGEGYRNFSSDMISKKLDIKELFLPGGAYFTKDQFADHPPGAYFSYTNCTWGIIASIIETVGQQRFDTYCREHIFMPMGIAADFNVTEITALDSLAVLYRFKDNEWKAQADDYKGNTPESLAYEPYELGRNGLIFGPQGSLRSSASDLAKFSLMLMNNGKFNTNQILQGATVDLMLDSQWRYSGENGDTWENFFLSYGFGTHQTLNKAKGDIIFPDRKMVGHPGIAYGLLSDMYFERDKKSGIVFITNGSKNDFTYAEESSFYQVEDDVFKAVYPYLKEMENQLQSENR